MIYRDIPVGEKTATEKAIIAALHTRDVWQRRQKHSSEETVNPTMQTGLPKLSDMYGNNNSAQGKYESPRHSRSGSENKTKYS